MKTAKQVTPVHSSLNDFRLKLSVVAVAACFSPALLANPVGPTVVHGAATFNTQGNTLSVTNTPGAILNWQQFNIAKGQTTQFIQQSANSSVLNRVTGPDPSQILGSLRSNGNVFLINPNGIMFGAGAIIDVNRLVASTLNITNADFLANNLRFTGNNGTSVINQGEITTPLGGSVYLIGNDVSNQGVITTPQGQVLLAAGSSVSLVDAFTPHVSVTVSAPAGGESLNLGQVSAQGGVIDMYGALVRQQGLVSADSASLDAQGRVVLSASQSTELAAGSVTSAANAAGAGGSVQILADKVKVAGAVDASGASGGGTILVGGDFQGKNPAVRNANTTEVTSSAVLKADALDQGKGGKLIVWANDATRAVGSLSARGGARGGDGGQIETSAHWLDVNGVRVDATAPMGKAGNWLLDPIDVTVVSAGSENGSLDTFGSWVPTSSPSQILNTTIETALNAGTNVSISTSLFEGDIDVNAPITKTGTIANTLQLTATRNVNLNSNISSNGGPLDVRTYTSTGATNLGNATISLAGGSLSAVAAPESGNGAMTLSAGKTFTANSDVQASTLAISGGTLAGSGGLRVTEGFSQTGGNIQTTGNVDISLLSGTLAVGSIQANSLLLRAPSLSIQDDLKASFINLSADNPITVAAGKTVIASDGATTNPQGYLQFSSYSSTNPLSLGASGLVDTTQISSLSGTATFRASNVQFSDPNAITLNSAVAGLDRIGLSAPSLTINNNVQAKHIDLFVDNPITVAAGKTVIATDGAASNPQGDLGFFSHSFDKSLVVGDGGLVTTSQISSLGGTATFRAPHVYFSSPAAIELNSPVSGLNSLGLHAPSLSINADVQAKYINLSADNPIMVAMDKTVIASDGAATNPLGSLGFSSFNMNNPLLLGPEGLVDTKLVSSLSGAGVFRTPNVHFYNANSITLDTALTGLDSVGLSAPSLNINNNVQAKYINLSAGNPTTMAAGNPTTMAAVNPITVAAGKTVIASDGAPANPQGFLRFTGFSPETTMVLDANGLVDTTQISSLSGAGVFRAPNIEFSNASAITLNSALTGLDRLRMSTSSLSLNNNLQADMIDLQASTISVGISGEVNARNFMINAPGGIISDGLVSGSGSITVGTGTAGLRAGGTINPGGVGQAGTINVVGDVELLGAMSTGQPSPTEQGAVVNFEIGGTGAGQSDRINVSGNFVQGGTLNVFQLPAYVPANGDTVTLGTLSGALSGSFDMINPLPRHAQLVPGQDLVVTYALSANTFTNHYGDQVWGNPSNWSAFALPDALDQVEIANGFAVSHAFGTDKVYSLSIASGSALDVSGGSLSVMGATTLDGALRVSGSSAGGSPTGATSPTTGGGTVMLNGTLDGARSGQVSVAGGNLFLNQPSSLSTLGVSSGSLGGSGALTVNGEFGQTGGSISLGGDFSATQVSGLMSLGKGTLNAASVALNSAGGVVLADQRVSAASGLAQVKASTLTLTSDTAAAGISGANVSLALTGDLRLDAGDVGTDKDAWISSPGAVDIRAHGIFLNGGLGGGGLGKGNDAMIFSKGDQRITVGAGGIHLTAGGGGTTETDNAATIVQGGITAPTPGSRQVITINDGGSVVVSGGSSGLTNVGAGHGSQAQIEADGILQEINFTAGGSLSLVGGSAGSRSRARVGSANGSQTITGATSITLTGGSGGGIVGEGNGALITMDSAAGTQTISAGSVAIQGGQAGTNNVGQIRSAGTQKMTVGSGGITITGGADGEGNKAGISTTGALQDISAASITMTAGAGGTANSAYIQAPQQNLTVDGKLVLKGGGSLSSGTDGGGARIGASDKEATNLNLKVFGDMTLSGGSVSGAALGSTGTVGGQVTNINVDVAGNVTLNPGTVTGAGSRIGSPTAGMAGGDIRLKAAGALTLNDDAVIRTLGDIWLDVASITQSANSRLEAAGLAVQTASGSTLTSQKNQLGWFKAINTGSGTIAFTSTNASGQILEVKGIDNAQGDIHLKAAGALTLNDDAVIRSLGDITLEAERLTQRANSRLEAAGLAVQTVSGSALNSQNNQIGWFKAVNTGSGTIAFTSTNASGQILDVQGIDNAQGDIVFTNYGGVKTSGMIRAAQGSLSMTSNSPLTIGAAGAEANGDLQLVASNLTSSGDLTLDGAVTSSAGAAKLSAANNFVQNSVVSAATSVDASAGGSMSFGPSSRTAAAMVRYSAAGLAVMPPGSGSTSQETQTCLTNPVLCDTTVTATNKSSDLPIADAQTAKDTKVTGSITFSLEPALVSTQPLLTAYKDIVVARSDARAADAVARQAQEKVAQARTPQERDVALALAKVASSEVDILRAEVRMREANSEVRAAEAEIRSVRDTQARLRAESRKAVAEAKRAEAEVDKLDAEAQKSESKAEIASTPQDKAAALEQGERFKAQKAEAKVKRAEVESSKAQVELRQVEAEAKLSNAPEVKAAVEAKRAELDVKKADVEVKRAEADIQQAKAPAEKAKAEDKLALAELGKARGEARQAEAEAKGAELRAKDTNSAIDKQVLEVKKSDVEVKKADVEVRQAQAEVKAAKTSQERQRAEEKQATAQTKMAERVAEKADQEVKVAEVLATKSGSQQAKQEVEAKRADAEVKKADLEVKKAQAAAVAAQAPQERESARSEQARAEVRKAEAELRQAELEARRDQDNARAPQSGHLKAAVDAKAAATVARLEAKRVELEVKVAQAEIRQAEADLARAQTPQARADAQQRLDAKRADIQTRTEKLAALQSQADAKQSEAATVKRRSDYRINEVFGGMKLADSARDSIQDALRARQEFKTGTFGPALSILQADPAAADLKPCDASGGDTCIRPTMPAMSVVLPKIQLPLLTPQLSYLPSIQRKVAVVIGNNAYQDPKIPSLDGALKDADAIGDIFQQNLGYEVRMVRNGTRADIVRTLNRVADETGSQDSVVVYYAGHGYQMPDTRLGYWIPTDAKVTDPGNWISNSDINKILASIPAKQMMMMSDSCYSGALTNENKITSGVAEDKVDAILAKRSVLVMSSGGEEPVLDEGKEGHSIFAWYLMDILKNVPRLKDGFGVFDSVKSGMGKENIEQKPQYGASTSAGHTPGGEYLFEVRKY